MSAKNPLKPRTNPLLGRALGNDFASEKSFPQDAQIEEAVLGAILLERNALMGVAEIIKPDFFYIEANQIIFEAILQIFERGEAIDLLTVCNELRRNNLLEKAGGIQYISRLTTKVNSAVHLEAHCRILNELAIRRQVIRTSDALLKEAYEGSEDVFELLDKAQQSLFDISEQNTARNYAPIKNILQQSFAELEQRRHQKEGLTGVPSGFIDLDRLTSGWQKSDLIILAARPGMGKTSMVLSILRNAAVDHNKAVVLFSLEMSSVQLANRLISSEAELESHKLKTGKLADYEWEQIIHKMNELNEAPIFIDDTPALSVMELRAKARRLKAQNDIQLIIIDYLQLMQGDSKSGNREQEIAHISRSLKQIAKELDVPVIALSQLSRAVETRGGDKRPMLSDLRESGCLAGDTLIFDAFTGKLLPIKELAERTNQDIIQCLAVNADFSLSVHNMVKVFYSGKKQIFEIKTRSGKSIKASANHPFLKMDSWTRLENLQIEDKIGTARKVDKNFDIFWDEITEITPLGIEDVYDATVEKAHNFVANDFIVHNSIEQDADMVIFLYRPEYYGITEDADGNPVQNMAEVIVAKHRNGALDSVWLKFIGKYTKFENNDNTNYSPNNYGEDFEQSNTVILKSRMNEPFANNDFSGEPPF